MSIIGFIICHVGDTIRYLFGNSARNVQPSLANCGDERLCVARTVRLDYSAVYAQKRSAAIFGVIHLFFHAFERGFGKPRAQFRFNRGTKLALQYLEQGFRKTFRLLQYHVARKAVGNEDVVFAGEYFPRFAVAGEVDLRILQQRISRF